MVVRKRSIAQRAGRLAIIGGSVIGLMAAVAPVTLAADEPVTIADFAFGPSTLTVQVGDSVTWTNTDGVAHTATATDGAFDTGSIAPSATATVTLDTAGSYAYRCSFHPAMTGTITVEAAASGGNGGSGGGAGQASAPPTDLAPLDSPEASDPAMSPVAGSVLLVVVAMLATFVIVAGRPKARAG